MQWVHKHLQTKTLTKIHCVKSFRTRSFLIRIFPHLDWISSPNAEKYGPENLEIRTLFTQWYMPAHRGSNISKRYFIVLAPSIVVYGELCVLLVTVKEVQGNIVDKVFCVNLCIPRLSKNKSNVNIERTSKSKQL